MEIKEIEGKKFIEFKEHEYQKKRLMVSVIFLILMVIAITAFVYTTITLVKSKNIIQKDPLKYGMEIHGFISCQCFDELGIEWYSVGEGFISQQQAGYGGELIGAG